MNLEIFKKHPYATAGGAVAVFVIVYYLSSKGGGGGGGATAASTGQYGLSGTDLQYMQIQAAQSAQATQVAAQVQTTQLQANVASQQIAATTQQNQDTLASQLAAIQAQTQAQVEVATSTQASQIAQLQIQGTTAVNLAQISADASTTQATLQAHANEVQTQALADISMNTANQQTAQQYNTLNYMATVAGYQTSLQSQSLTDQTVIAQNEIQNQHDLSTQALDIVRAAGLNHGTSNLENTLAQITESAILQPGAAIATAQSAAAEAYAGNQPGYFTSLVNGATSVLNTVANGLFAPGGAKGGKGSIAGAAIAAM